MDINDIRLSNARTLAEGYDTLAQFAETISRASTQVSRIIGKNPTRAIGTSLARHIETCTGMPHGWLDVARDPAAADVPEVRLPAEPALQHAQHIPYGPLILTFQQALDPSDSISMLNSKPIAERAFISPRNLQTLSSQAFGVYMEDDAMRSTDERQHASLNSWQKDDLLIFDQVPMEEVTPGSLVMAAVQGAEKAVFRKYRDKGVGKDGEHLFELVPLNEDYPIISIGGAMSATITGVLRITQREQSPSS